MADFISHFTETTTRILRMIPKLLTLSKKMEDSYTQGNLREANELSLQGSRLAEKLALHFRMLPIYMGSPSAKKDIEKILAEEIPIEIGFTAEGWFSIRLPRLLPKKEDSKKKETGSLEYIRGYLYPALDRFFQTAAPVHFTDCFIVYRHIYTQDAPERKYRDHDNIECNCITDALALYLMPDDSALHCQHCYLCHPGTTERTEVYIVPEPEFTQWYHAAKSYPDKGVKLHVQTPFRAEKDIPKQG